MADAETMEVREGSGKGMRGEGKKCRATGQ